MKFKTAFTYEKSKAFEQDLSREVVDVIELDDDEKPVKVGEHNVYEEIQSYADECSIYSIIARVGAGDLSALGDPESAVYGDVSNMPHDYLEALELKDNALQEFAKLPIELRQQFDNDVTKFLLATDEEVSKAISSISKDSTKVEDYKEEVKQ